MERPEKVGTQRGATKQHEAASRPAPRQTTHSSHTRATSPQNCKPVHLGNHGTPATPKPSPCRSRLPETTQAPLPPSPAHLALALVAPILLPLAHRRGRAAQGALLHLLQLHARRRLGLALDALDTWGHSHTPPAAAAAVLGWWAGLVATGSTLHIVHDCNAATGRKGCGWDPCMCAADPAHTSTLPWGFACSPSASSSASALASCLRISSALDSAFIHRVSSCDS